MLATFALVTGGVPILILTWLYLAPGINWTIPFLITALPTMEMGFLFYVSAVTMPRSGGDYVFNSRALNPVIGFVNYWGLFIGFAFSLGYYSYLGASWFGYLLSGFGLAYNNTSMLGLASFFESNIGSVIIGGIIIAISTIIVMSNKVHWNFILVSGIITWITTAIMFYVLSTITPASFASSLSSFTGIHNAYNEVISDAQANGLSFIGAGIVPSLLAIPLIWYYFTWYNLPASWSGEMKKVKFNVLISIIVALLLIAVYYVAFTDVNLHAFGEKFLTSWSYINCNGVNDPVYSRLSSIGDFTPFFSFIVNHNIPLFIIMWIAIW
ncbi:APC family permease, partial [Acidianus sp. DSM 29099]